MQSVVVFGRYHRMETDSEASERLKRFAMKYDPGESLVDEKIEHTGKPHSFLKS